MPRRVQPVLSAFVDPQMLATVRELARVERRSISAIVRDALADWLARK